VTCLDCKYKGKVDVSGAFGSFIVPCKIDADKMNCMVDWRNGCSRHEVEIKKLLPVEIEVDGQMLLFKE
jgi:hypothetical protein